MEEQNSYIVYMHTNKINNKRYIGITKQNPEKRWSRGKGYGNNKYFTNSIIKYTWDGFKHEILFEKLLEQDAKNKEIELINLYQSNNREFGYNLSAGGDGSNGCLHTKEEKEKMSKNRKGKCKGEEHYLYGKHRSEEIKNKMSESKKGENNAWYGKKHTKDEIIKMSESKKGNKNPNFNKFGKDNPHSKSVICIETSTIYDSITQVNELLKINTGNISSCCNNILKSAGKLEDGTRLHWMFYDDYISKQNTLI